MSIKVPTSQRYDVIVVGAGIGGLITAAYLGRAGKRVLVLDQHYVAGGNATIFRRKKWEFDVGLHYIGECGPEGTMTRVFESLGIGDELRFGEMDPDGFEVYRFPDLEFRVPKGLERYRDRLVETFPSEQRGIDRYIRFLRECEGAVLEMGRAQARLFEGGPLHALGGLPGTAGTLWRNKRFFRWANATLSDVLDSCTRDPRLRAVLAGQNGTYALPPKEVSAPMHAMLVMHYMRGAFYPQGGGQVIADALHALIERQDGEVVLRAPVEKILVEKGRAVGVRCQPKNHDSMEIRSDVVISNADLKRTYEELIDPEHLSARSLSKTRGYRMSWPLGVVYVCAELDPVELGLDNANYWLFPNYDFDAAYAQLHGGGFLDDPFVYISNATLKDPDNPAVTSKDPAHPLMNVQLMTVCPPQAAFWKLQPDQTEEHRVYRKVEGYQEQKQRFAETLLRSSESVFPGLRDKLLHHEVATPITHTRYTRSTDGTSYGLALTPAQFGIKRPDHQTEIAGLYLCGANLRTGHGIMGSMLSGVTVSAAILSKERAGLQSPIPTAGVM